VRTLVTGASGFLGAAVCSELISRGHPVAALVRRQGSEPEGTTAVRGDLTDTASLGGALSGGTVECVIHCAAEIASQRSEERIRRVNVEGTRALIEACQTAGVRRFVFISTVVTGDAKGALLEEDSELPVETAYGRSKQEGERLLRASGLQDVVIRPGHVYGAGGWYASELVKRLRQPGRLAVVGRGDNWWDVVRVEDVAAAVVSAAESAQAGSLYHVADDEPIRLYDFVSLTAEALGVGKPRRIPARLAALVAGGDPVRAVVRSARTSNQRLKDQLGWSPRFPTAREGVPDAVAALSG
jgi:nucleoside-diphosphate-sugar epimerase